MNCDICKQEFYSSLNLRHHKMLDKIGGYEFDEYDIYVCNECDAKISKLVRVLLDFTKTTT